MNGREMTFVSLNECIRDSQTLGIPPAPIPLFYKWNVRNIEHTLHANISHAFRQATFQRIDDVILVFRSPDAQQINIDEFSRASTSASNLILTY